MQSDNVSSIPVQPDRKWVYRTPLVISSLVVITVLVSVVLFYGPQAEMNLLQFRASLIPARYNASMIEHQSLVALIAPMFTHIFLHGGLMHLMLNMLFLLAFGTPVANRMMFNNATGQPNGTLTGSIIFVLFYLASGVTGGILFTVMHLNDPVLAVGASGAISALMAAAIRIARPVGNGKINIYGPLTPILDPRILRFSLVIIGLNVLVGLFGNKLIPSGDAIAWEAHIGGYLFGLLCFPFFDALAQRLHPLTRRSVQS